MPEGWVVRESEQGRQHVIRISEENDHEATDCWCNPVDLDGIIIHNDKLGVQLGLHPKHVGVRDGLYHRTDN